MKTFHKACQNILDNKDSKALNWAVGYARHGLTVNNEFEAGTQALYILNNITHWRGETAKETRQMLKDFVNHDCKSNWDK